MALLRRRTADDHCEEALSRSRVGDHEGALVAADRAIAIEPEHAMAYHVRGWALSERGRHADALAALRQAIALDPGLAYVQYKIALELNLLGRSAEALQAVDAAIGMAPEDTAPVILRGSILFDLQRYVDALDAFSSALEREPGSGAVRFNRAQVLRRLGRFAEALTDYDEALRLAPELPGVRDQKGIALAMAGQYDGALAEFGVAAAAARGRPSGTADVWAAAIAWHRQDPAQARRLFQRAAGRRMGMNRWESVNMRAVVSCALGRAEPAENMLRGAAGSADPAAQDVLARLYDLLSAPPMPGMERLRAIALGS